MRRLLLILLATILIAPVAADQFIFDDTLYQAREIELDISVQGAVSWSGSASTVQAKLFYYPKAFDGQEVLTQTTTPQAQQGVDSLAFSWQNPQPPVTFTHASTVSSSYNRPRISAHIDFPYTSVPAELDKYMRSEEIIMITDDITRVAEEIVGDETDAVRAAYKLGSWVKDNIQYDLNSVTAEASMSSQWVLENREGVCDELTSLFIAMLRSQGVPARFVSGIAYTNLEELDTPWGPHGWAEVWFPGVGWVPYDVTYGQYGWVDATHVAFLKSTDALSSAAEYSMRGRDAQLQPATLQRDVELTGREGEVPLYVTYQITPALKSVGPGGYNRIDVTLTNDMPFYVSTELFLARTSRLTTDDYSRSVLLAPRETRTVSWLVRVSEELEPGFEYTFPVVIYTNNNQQWRSEFTASASSYAASREELALAADEPVVVARSLSCDAPRVVAAGEEFSIQCSASDTQICLEGTCSQDSLTVTKSFSEVGVYNVVVTADQQRRVLTISAEDEPAYELSIQAPATLAFSQTTTINVTAHKTSVSAPRDVEVSLAYPLHEQRWEVPVLTDDMTFQLEVRGDQLTSGKNVFVARSGAHEVTATIQATPSSFRERVTLWMNSLTGFLTKLL